MTTAFPMTSVEMRAETSSLESLHAERRSLLTEYAKLIALYGPFGMYDDHRKHYVEAQKIRARMDLKAQGEKTTESMIDAYAYGSSDYERFIDNALGEKVEYLRVANRLTELEELIRDREIKLRAYCAEINLR